MLELLMKFVIVLLVIGALVTGCTKTVDNTDNIASQLPAGATNINWVGNGWYTFDVMSGNGAGCYLVKSRSAGYQGYGYITQRPCG